jgi:hypothetical protein
MSDTHENSTPISLIAEEFSVSNKKLLHCACDKKIPLYYWLKGDIGYVQKGLKSWQFLSLETHDNDNLVPLSYNNMLKLLSKKFIEVDGYNDAENVAAIHPIKKISRKDLYVKEARYDELHAALTKLCETHQPKAPVNEKLEIGLVERNSWLKFMLCATAMIAKKNKGKFLHNQPNKKNLIFNYAQLEIAFREVAVQLFGGDTNDSSSDRGLSDATIEKFLQEALDKYPLNIDLLYEK